MDDVLKEELEALKTKVITLEALLTPNRIMSHDGIAIAVGDGLRGGGTIDRTRGIGLALDELEVETPRFGTELVPYYSPQEGGHCTVALEDLVKVLYRLMDLPSKFAALENHLAQLTARVELFTFYERLYTAESRIQKLEEELEDARKEREAATLHGDDRPHPRNGQGKGNSAEGR